MLSVRGPGLFTVRTSVRGGWNIRKSIDGTWDMMGRMPSWDDTRYLLYIHSDGPIRRLPSTRSRGLLTAHCSSTIIEERGNLAGPTCIVMQLLALLLLISFCDR